MLMNLGMLRLVADKVLFFSAVMEDAMQLPSSIISYDSLCGYFLG